IFEAFVAASVVLARNLKQQLFELIEAAQAVTGNRIGKTRAQHDELVLPLVFRSPDSAPDRAVKPPQLALGAGIHVAHPADDSMGLVIQVEAIGDQLIELNLRRAFRPATIAAPAVSTAFPSIATLTPIASVATFSPLARTSPFARGPVLAWRATRACFLL